MRILLLSLVYHTYMSFGNPSKGLTKSLHKAKTPQSSVKDRWYPLDCQDVWKRGFLSGEYTIYPEGSYNPLPVYCDITSNRRVWTVFQNRFDGSVDFNQNWQTYKKGFGNANGEYWLGLQNIYRLTMQGRYELMLEMENMNGLRVYAQYQNFSLSPHALNAESDGYKLHVDGFIDGGAGDILSAHVGQMFSTYDKDEEEHIQNCAEYYGGGFWYESLGCANTPLNARYMSDDSAGTQPFVGFSWSNDNGLPLILRSSQMKMRRLQGKN